MNEPLAYSAAPSGMEIKPMKIIFSRKGFDTGSGGAPSPILAGCPISLPIPARGRSVTTYGDLGFGEIVERATRGKINRDHLCHEDPMFVSGECFFGQCGAAQSHLQNNGVGLDDLFLFFGLFCDEATGERHHRIFGFLRVNEVAPPSAMTALGQLIRPHPHTLGEWNENNTVYRGEGMVASKAHGALRLTQPGGPLCHWIVPAWLASAGLTYHGASERWLSEDRLATVARGQEFVTDVGESSDARRWAESIIGAIRS